jgi:hypothetical protein
MFGVYRYGLFHGKSIGSDTFLPFMHKRCPAPGIVLLLVCGLGLRYRSAVEIDLAL